MLDNRKAIAGGKELVFGRNKRYWIAEEIGRGASCIVYSAYYEDKVGCRHQVRLKECYPCGAGIRRRADGGLEAEPEYGRMFEDAKEKFCTAYRRNVSLQGTLGLVNSTVDAIDLYAYNDTWYLVAACVEGSDYRTDMDEDMQSVFIRVLALSEIIQKYHSHGVLHLDIKPENMLLIPETKEHLMLFDFDSLLFKEELADKRTLRFSFSDGYAAPELVRGDRRKISEASDIYSIGAVVYYKLFGRTPDVVDGAAGAVYDYARMRYQDERYPPELFRVLDEFLHKTLSASVTYRWKSMEQVVPKLEMLRTLSDINTVFLCHNFSYHTACFVGRRRELEEIAGVFASGQRVLFLSGIGGIGKTELARRYAFEYAADYRSIVFVPFAGSIFQTVMGNDLRLNRIKKDELETDEDYFVRKCSALQTAVSSEDLILLDNFDVERDENLERLLACPCRFLITTREDYSDYNYAQISVGKMERMDDLMQLFYNYHAKASAYPQAQLEHVRNIIETAERHTMTVELLAKYLRITGDSPHSLLERLWNTEGIAGIGDIKIRHRKDRQLSAGSINSHLLILFKLSGFSDTECELLRSLSLLGPVRILKSRFLELCPLKGGKDGLENLIRRGWVEYDKTTGKVSLHQILSDMVYHYLKPDSGNCPHIVRTMTELLGRSLGSRTEQDSRDRLLGHFIQRIQGSDLAYAGLCVSYCQKIGDSVQLTEELLDRAEQVCLSKERPQEQICLSENAAMGTADGGVSSALESERLLMEICRRRLQLAGLGDDMLKLMYEQEDFDEAVYFDRQSVTMCSLARQAYAHAAAYCSAPDYLAGFCVELALELDQASVGNFFLTPIDEESAPMNRILDLAVTLLDDALEYLESAGIEASGKERLYAKIRDFFGSYEFTHIYRSEHYADTQKAYRCQKMVERYRIVAKAESKSDENGAGDETVFYLQDLRLDEIAWMEENKKEYEKAIRLYQKAWEHKELPDELALMQIAQCYLNIGRTDEAVKSMKQLLELDKKDSYYSSTVCWELIQILRGRGCTDEAGQYARELIQYNSAGAEKKETQSSCLMWMIAASFCLYQMEPSGQQKEAYWNDCLSFFESLPQTCEFSEQMADFLTAAASRISDRKERILTLFGWQKRCGRAGCDGARDPLLDEVIRLCENRTEDAADYVRALLRYAARFHAAAGEEAEERAAAYCEKAWEVYKDARLDDAHLYNRIWQISGKCCGRNGGCDYEHIQAVKSRCDYYALASDDAAGKEKSVQVEIWKEAADSYEELDNYAMEARCYDRIWELEPEPSEYRSLAQKRIWCYLRIGGSMDGSSYGGTDGGMDSSSYGGIDGGMDSGLYDREKIFEKISESIWELYQNAADEMLRKQDGGREAFLRRAEQFCERAEECADYFMQGGMDQEAARLYLSAAAAALDTDLAGRNPQDGKPDTDLAGRNLQNGKPDTDLAGRNPQDGKPDTDLAGRNPQDGKPDTDPYEEALHRMAQYAYEDLRVLKAAVSDALHGAVSRQGVDAAVRIYQKLQPLLEKNPDFSKLRQDFQWFFSAYQYRDVEFKR